jgi:hypothetical protein
MKNLHSPFALRRSSGQDRLRANGDFSYSTEESRINPLQEERVKVIMTLSKKSVEFFKI